MGTIIGVRKAVEDLYQAFPVAMSETLEENSRYMKYIVQDQLMAGQDAKGNSLTPSYLDDPYFIETTKTVEGARAKAEWYKNWKKKLYPPETTELLHLAPRSENTPNLIIRGDYHYSITPEVIGDKLVIKSIGFPGADDIENKYGSDHLGLGNEGIWFLRDHFISPAIKELFKKYGF